jgi:hypothetical protein
MSGKDPLSPRRGAFITARSRGNRPRACAPRRAAARAGCRAHRADFVRSIFLLQPDFLCLSVFLLFV